MEEYKWDDVAAMSDDVVAAYQDLKDFTVISEVIEYNEKIKAIHEQKNADCKQIIKALTHKMEETKRGAVRTESRESHISRVYSLNEEKKWIESHIAELQEQEGGTCAQLENN